MGLTYDFSRGCWLRGGVEEVSTVVLLSEGFVLMDLVEIVDRCLMYKKERVSEVVMAKDKRSDWRVVVKGIKSSVDLKEEYRDLSYKVKRDKKKKCKEGYGAKDE